MKLYVLANNKLSKAQQWVQAAHAVAQHFVDFPDTEWKNYTLVMLQCPDLEEWANMLEYQGVEHSVFTEPHFQGMLTAISSLHIGDKTGKLKLI
jgi:hypothetical protein